MRDHCAERVGTAYRVHEDGLSMSILKSDSLSGVHRHGLLELANMSDLEIYLDCANPNP